MSSSQNPKKPSSNNNSKTEPNSSTINPNNNSNSTSKKNLHIQYGFKIPKNVNEYRHIIEIRSTQGSDVEYMLGLRHYNKINRISKNISLNAPSFYEKDLEKYRKKNILKYFDRQLLKTNIATFEHILDHPAGLPANNIIFRYETTIRNEKEEEKKNKNKNNNNNNENSKFKKKFINPIPWNSTTFPTSKNLFDTFLPPILQNSKNNFEKIKERCGRPLIQINGKYDLNGTKLRQRKFELSNNVTLRSPSDHLPSSRYNNDFGTRNMGEISYLLNYDNINSTSLWGTNLRDYKKIKKNNEKKSPEKN